MGRIVMAEFVSWLFQPPARLLPTPRARAFNDDDELHARWRCDWEAHCQRLHKARLRRRSILALALWAEPEERQIREAYMDMAWSAWYEVVAEVRRARALPELQRVFEQR